MGWEDAVAGLAGSAVGGLFGQKSNKAAAKEAQKNRDWQERMDNTKHQREVKDLVAAGLNPILSANSASSVPSGGVASQSNPFNGLGQEVNSALRLGRVDREKFELEQKIGEETIKNTQSATAKNEAETAKTAVDTQLQSKQIEVANQTLTNMANDNLIKSFTIENILPKQAELMRSQSSAALASAGASTASALFDQARKQFLDLDIKKRSKSTEIEAEAEFWRTIFGTVSSGAEAASSVIDTVYESLPSWRKMGKGIFKKSH